MALGSILCLPGNHLDHVLEHALDEGLILLLEAFNDIPSNPADIVFLVVLQISEE